MNYDRPQPLDRLIADIAARDAENDFERAIGWVVSTCHPNHRSATETLTGLFTEPSAALTYAAQHEAEMREDDSRWTCTVLPVLPVL